MSPPTSDPLPQRVRELVDSVKADLASLPEDPQARAAAVVKITGKMDELKKQVQQAPAPIAVGLKRLMLAELAKLALQGILDILIRWVSIIRGFPRSQTIWA